MLKRARFLDVREAEDARRSPILDSVNIPLSELESRVAELPPKEDLIEIADSPTAPAALKLLLSRDRLAVRTGVFDYGSDGIPRRLWEPNEYLHEILPSLKPGTALDLGCGGGRDAVHLAESGWDVVAVDRLPDSLERGKELAERYLDDATARRIEWRTADALARSFRPGEFDLVLMFFFFDPVLLEGATIWLKAGGSILVEAFTTLRQAKEGKPRSARRVVGPGHLRDLLGGLEIVNYEEEEHARGHTARAWARKCYEAAPTA